MKLVLANNQSDRFVAFYRDLQQRADEPFDYAGYRSLLFYFYVAGLPNLAVQSLQTKRFLHEYDGVYINGYLSTYELAASVAVACKTLGVSYANKELSEPPSLSKLSMYAKLTAAGVPVPPTIAGTKIALAQNTDDLKKLKFPVVAKRADADRGIDNFKAESVEEVLSLLADYEDNSLWLVQEFVPNEGFYLLSFYDGKPVFCIFRKLEPRPDNNPRKAHMYKPKGGANASLIPLGKVPAPLLDTAHRATRAMNRQIASVDCLYDPETEQTHVLEVNYNPQLVTIETFKEERIEAFLKGLSSI